MKNPYQENPFRLLGLTPHATKSQIVEKARELEGLLDIGEIQNITKAQIVNSRRELLLARQRLLQELYTFYLTEPSRPEPNDESYAVIKKNPFAAQEEEVAVDHQIVRDELNKNLESENAFEPVIDPDGLRFDNETKSDAIRKVLCMLPFPDIDYH
jgi:hypothetical protein